MWVGYISLQPSFVSSQKVLAGWALVSCGVQRFDAAGNAGTGPQPVRNVSEVRGELLLFLNGNCAPLINLILFTFKTKYLFSSNWIRTGTCRLQTVLIGPHCPENKYHT